MREANGWTEGRKFRTRLIVAGTALFVLLLAGGMWGCPTYNVWQKDLKGKATLAEAEWDRQIAVAEAKARVESAEHDKEAEIIRAQGVAEANRIIGDSLKDNDAYLRYLWINGLHDGTSETIYIPTEGNLPILEATRKVRTND